MEISLQCPGAKNLELEEVQKVITASDKSGELEVYTGEKEE